MLTVLTNLTSDRVVRVCVVDASGGEFSIGAQPNLQNVALRECIGERPRTKLRGGVRLIDPPNQEREFRSAVFEFGL